MCEISIIIPIYNGEKWIDSCLQSIASQTIIRNNLNIEIVIFNDGSTDKTKSALETWHKYFQNLGLGFILSDSAISRGVGAAKNGAVNKSSGRYLCFQDIDDIMHPDRILSQWEYATNNQNTLVGTQIIRSPLNSTPRFVQWANNLTPTQLKLQVYTSNGPTLLMPTWFCHRLVYDRVGGFDESGAGTPEDLIFFHKHLDLGGDLYRIEEKLVTYTYHENAATFSVTRERIWRIQLDRIEECILPYWKSFTIWNAGKSGRKLVRGLKQENLKKLISFCDIDEKKIGRTIELYCPFKRKVLIKVPVVHFMDANPPFIICIKLNLTNGQFESNLKSLNLKEGSDYILFN